MASALIYPWFTYPNMVIFSAKCELTSRVVVHYSGSSVSSPPLIGPLSRGDCRKIQKQVMSFWTPRLAWKGLRPDLTKQETVVLFVLTDERHSHLWVRHIYMHIYKYSIHMYIWLRKCHTKTCNNYPRIFAWWRRVHCPPVLAMYGRKYWKVNAVSCKGKWTYLRYRIKLHYLNPNSAENQQQYYLVPTPGALRPVEGYHD